MTATERRVKRGWMNLKVTQVIEETHDTKTFVMEDAEEGGRPFDYWAGQYLTFRFDDLSPKPLVRSYTMSSSPVQGNYSAFTVKRVDRGVISNWLCDEVKVGTILRGRGPIGRFCFEPERDLQHLVMVAAGSGVTPFVSIMREHMGKLGCPGSPKEMTLLVAYRSREDLILWDDLVKLQHTPGVQVVTTLSRDPEAGHTFIHGRPDRKMLAHVLGSDLSGRTFMTCGPESMMQMVKDYCLEHGAAPEQVKLESFAS